MAELFVWVGVFVYHLRSWLDLEVFVWHSAAVRARAGPPGLEVNWIHGNLNPKGYALAILLDLRWAIAIIIKNVSMRGARIVLVQEQESRWFQV